MVPYQYSPLDESLNEIRLLELHPGHFSADLHVSIRKATLILEAPPIHEALLMAGPPTYEALSYVWGTTENPVEIKVGPSGSETLAITQNLAIALPYLRHEKHFRTLWIDAICINQQNLHERSSQVKMMGDIYRLADRVVVWLGIEKDNSAHILKLLSQLGSENEVDYRLLRVSPASSESAFPWSDRNSTFPYSDQEVRDMGALFSRPWFSRLWVCQEIRLAGSDSIFICSSETMLCRTFFKAIFYLTLKRWDGHDAYFLGSKLPEQMLQVLDLYGMEIELGLCETIRKLHPFRCSDARDRIYSVLSLLHRLDKGFKIEPNYTQTTAVIYKDFALKYIEYRQRLDILAECDIPIGLAVGLPTWVPNWDIAPIALPLHRNNSAGGPSQAKVEHKEDGILSVMGLISATVMNAEEIIFDSTLSLIDEIRRHAPSNQENSEYVSGESLLDAFVSTLCANAFVHTSSPPVNKHPRFEESRGFVQNVLQNTKPPPSAFANAAVYLGYIHGACRNRSFITTKEGYIGLAPSETKPGDQICILLGCRIAMILRPASHSQHQVVGESYVHGLMDGEAFLGPFPGKYQSINVVLEGAYHRAYLDKQTGDYQWNDPRIKEEDQIVDQDGGLIVHDGSEGPEVKPDIFQRRGLKLQEFDLV
ncbi:heterokaryon incompatibility protein-domain-containing protein [Usnea florida]